MKTRSIFPVAAQSAAKKRAVKSAKKSTSSRTYQEGFNEGLDEGVRHCVEAMLIQGDSRDYVAGVLVSGGMDFPSTDDPAWNGKWAFDDWDDWIAAEESEDAS